MERKCLSRPVWTHLSFLVVPEEPAGVPTGPAITLRATENLLFAEILKGLHRANILVLRAGGQANSARVSPRNLDEAIDVDISTYGIEGLFIVGIASDVTARAFYYLVDYGNID